MAFILNFGLPSKTTVFDILWSSLRHIYCQIQDWYHNVKNDEDQPLSIIQVQSAFIYVNSKVHKIANAYIVASCLLFIGIYYPQFITILEKRISLGKGNIMVLDRTAYQFDEWVDTCPWPQVNPACLVYIPTNYILPSVDVFGYVTRHKLVMPACCKNTSLFKLNCIFLDTFKY